MGRLRPCLLALVVLVLLPPSAFADHVLAGLAAPGGRDTARGLDAAKAAYWFVRVAAAHTIEGLSIRPTTRAGQAPCPGCPRAKTWLKPQFLVSPRAIAQEGRVVVEFTLSSPGEAHQPERVLRAEGRARDVMQVLGRATEELVRALVPNVPDAELEPVRQLAAQPVAAFGEFTQGMEAFPGWPREPSVESPDRAAAADAHARAIAASPSFLPSHVALALLGLSDSHNDAALETLDQALQKHGDWLGCYRLALEYVWGNGRSAGMSISQRQSALRRLSQLAPDDLGIALSLGALLEIQTPKLALAHYEEMLVRRPQNGVILRSKARMQEKLGDYEGMLATLSQPAASADPSPLGQRLRARALAGVGRLDEAIAILEKAIESDPHDAWAGYDLSRMYERAGLFEKAIALSEQRRRLEPHGSRTPFDYVYLANMHAQAGHRAEAERLWAKAVQLDPKFASYVTQERLRVRRENLRLEPALQQRMTIGSFGRPLGEVFDQIEQDAGVVLRCQKAMRKAPIFLQVQDATIWECMRQIGEQLQAEWDLLYLGKPDEVEPSYWLRAKKGAEGIPRRGPCPTCP